MRDSSILPLCLAAFVSLAACGEAAPDAKTAGDVATVDVKPVPASADLPPEPTAEPETPEPPSKQTVSKPSETPPPPPAAPLVGPSGPSGGTATVMGQASVPTAALQALAATDAVGMTPTGSAMTASFKAGQTLEFQLLLTPGRCYTILATGPASIQAMEVTMGMSLPGLPMPPAVIAQGSGTSSTSIGGKASGCYRNPMPLALPATVTVKVTAGTGVVGVQVYGK